MRSFRQPSGLLQVLASPLLIFVAALAMRLAMMAHLLAAFGASTFYLHNECANIASSLVSGAGFSSPWDPRHVAPTAQQPPLYPLLLAAIFRLFGAFTRTSAVVALALNSLAAALTAVLLPSLGEVYLHHRRSGVLAAWIFALAPYESIIGLQLWSQALAALMLVGFLSLLAAPHRPQRKRDCFFLGCYLGAVALLNPVLALALACVFIARIGITRRALLGLAGFLLLLAPWTLRNFLVFGRPIPLRDNFGFEVWVGNHEGLPLRHPMAFRGAFPMEDYRQANFDELKFLSQKAQEARRYIAARPAEFVQRCAWRVLEFWMTPAPGYWLLASLLAWAGAILAWPRNTCFLLLLLIFPLVYYVTHVWPNYRHPIEPIIILLATYAVLRALSAVVSGRMPARHAG
ncbi:MAG TPA: hypothetical protein VLC12_01530 [Terriglobales bacterium]|nr:hypothetical protein [Terriglobales bacterium]